jgi:hypothetical protein
MLVGSSSLPGVVLPAFRTALSTWVIDILGNGRELNKTTEVFIDMSPVSVEFWRRLRARISRFPCISITKGLFDYYGSFIGGLW